jgi:hypothetical protein
MLHAKCKFSKRALCDREQKPDCRGSSQDGAVLQTSFLWAMKASNGVTSCKSISQTKPVVCIGT